MGLPMRKQIRLPDYDYSSPGAYFVTICTHEKRRILSRRHRPADHFLSALALSRRQGRGVQSDRVSEALRHQQNHSV